MSDCGICLTYDESGCDYFIDDCNIIPAPHDLKCCECGRKVKTGDPIECATVLRDGDEDAEEDEHDEQDDVYTCIICAEIANAFYCNGRLFGGRLWDSMYEVFEGLTTSCFDRLTTPEAKKDLQQRWMRWKGLKA